MEAAEAAAEESESKCACALRGESLMVWKMLNAMVHWEGVRPWTAREGLWRPYRFSRRRRRRSWQAGAEGEGHSALVLPSLMKAEVVGVSGIGGRVRMGRQ